MERALRIADHLYSALLGLYPKTFRAAHGQQMRLTFHDSCSEAYRRGGDGGLIALWLATLFDLIKTALEQRARQGEILMSKEWLSDLAGTLTIVVGVLALGGLVGEIVWLFMPSEPVWEFFNFTLSTVAFVVMLPAVAATLVRYRDAASKRGRIALTMNVAACAGIVLALIASIPLQILRPHEPYPVLNVILITCMLALIAGHILFGIDALQHKLLTRWHATPILVGIAPLLLAVPLVLVNPESELGRTVIPNIAKIQSIAVGVSTVLMGYAMLGRRSAQEAAASAL